MTTVKESPRKGAARHLTLAEICEDLRISPSTFYDWRAKKKAPPSFKIPNGELRFRRADYEDWLATLDGEAA
jgi:predicted DNA-binding transcriptional regulator AlpA